MIPGSPPRLNRHTLEFMVDDIEEATGIRVVTEAGVVFMMGLVTQAEADAAVEAASGVQGVQKIVKVFDYAN